VLGLHAPQRSGPIALHNCAVDVGRDVGIVLSGGGMNGVLMELGFLRRVRESPLWPRVVAIFGTSAGALAGSLAALDRLDELEEFLLGLRAEDAFRPNRLWRLPLLGLHDYALPRTIAERLGDPVETARALRDAPIELVVVATDVTGDEAPDEATELELVYSSRTAEPEQLAQAVLASAAVSGLVLPVRVGDRIATDGGWVRNFPLAHAYAHPRVEQIVAFRYLPRYPRIAFDPLDRLRRRVERLPRVPPVKALLAELDEAEERGARGEPIHLLETITRLMRVTLLRNTAVEERQADETDASIRELAALRRDVLALVDASVRGGRRERLRAAIDARFGTASFPFRHERQLPRITVRGTADDVSLEPGFRSSREWSEEAKRALVRRGYELADAELAALDRRARAS
jgi:predicted acylesterase/phospholipase RssA